MTVVNEVTKLLESVFKSQAWSNKLLSAQGLDPHRLVDVAPMDDEVEPLTPTGIQVKIFLKSLTVEWAVPPKDDHVVKAIVEGYQLVDPDDIPDTTVEEGEGKITVEVTEGNGHLFNDLEYEPYKFRVQFVDMWDRYSAWSAWSDATVPAETADYRFDMAKIRESGVLGSYLEEVNAELQIPGNDFAEGVVRQVALAQPEHPNQLPMIEVDFDQWDVNTIWPPLDKARPVGNAEGRRYINSPMPVNTTAAVVDYNGRKWLQVNRGEATHVDYIAPFADFKRRETMPGVSYIASVYVQGAENVKVKFGVDMSANTGTTFEAKEETPEVTLDGSPEGQRIYFKFTMDALGDKPYIRFRIHNMQENTVTRWTRFQLEQADLKTQPSSWTPGVFSTGVLNSRMLTTIDAIIGNAIFEDAAIRSAAIIELTADKIKAGVLNAGTITVASTLTISPGSAGKIIADKTIIDGQGMSLQVQPTYLNPIDSGLISSAITSRNPSGTNADSAIAFFDNRTDKRRGILLRADGDDSNDGHIVFHCTNSGTLSKPSSAKLELTAGKANSNDGRVFISRHLEVADSLTSGTMKASSFKVVSGGDNNNKDLVDLIGHKHDYSDLNNTPNLSGFYKKDDNIVTGDLTVPQGSTFKLYGKTVRISGNSLVVGGADAAAAPAGV